MQLPNCVECGDNKRVTIVEALGDNDWYIVFRVCCSGCGRDWQWQCYFSEPEDMPETPEDVDAYLRMHGYDPEQLVEELRARIKPPLDAALKRLRGEE